MAEQKIIKEIVCLKSIVQETGRPRVLKPSDFEDGSQWDRQVEQALGDAASYEIRREVIYSEEEQNEDLSRIELKDMTVMSRERVAEIAAFYGIKDESQSRSTLIEQIAGEKQREEDILTKLQTTGKDLGDKQAPKKGAKASGDSEGEGAK